MPRTATSKTLTVRLNPELYSAAQGFARQRNLSLNALLQESLIATLNAAEEKGRYNDYSLLGQDAECETEYAIHAQAEVMLSGSLS